METEHTETVVDEAVTYVKDMLGLPPGDKSPYLEARDVQTEIDRAKLSMRKSLDDLELNSPSTYEPKPWSAPNRLLARLNNTLMVHADERDGRLGAAAFLTGNRLRHEIQEPVIPRRETFIPRQLFRILDGCAARYLFIDKQNCSSQSLGQFA